MWSQGTLISYVMQTLWRDLASECDIVGPYYTSSGAFKARSIFNVSWMHYENFIVMALVSML